MPTETNNRRLTKEELANLRSRLPARAGIINEIAKKCGCFPSKVSRVFSGELHNPQIIEVARIYAEKYEADVAKLLADIRAIMADSPQPLQK